MSNLIPFEFNGTAVRVVEKDGEPFFVAKDVAELLGYAKPRNAIAAHCKGALNQGIPTDGGIQEMSIIPERDVYRLIMKSKLPAAEQFEEWVVGTVLPSIRKNGGYIADQENLTPEEIVAKALFTAQSIIERKQQVIEQQQAVIEQIQPKAEALDRLALADGSVCITDAAKLLQVQKPKDLFGLLQREHWIYRRSGSTTYVGYQDKIQQGLLEHKVTEITRTDGSGKVTQQVRITPKGLAKLGQMITPPHAA